MENNEEMLEPETPEEEINTDEPSEELEDEVCDILANDVDELKGEFSELGELQDVTELDNPTRYAALRDLGLSPREAYLATRMAPKQDNRSHLRGAPAVNTRRTASSMTMREWQVARALFENLSDGEIEKLYRKVTK